MKRKIRQKLIARVLNTAAPMEVTAIVTDLEVEMVLAPLALMLLFQVAAIVVRATESLQV